MQGLAEPALLLASNLEPVLFNEHFVRLTGLRPRTLHRMVEEGTYSVFELFEKGSEIHPETAQKCLTEQEHTRFDEVEARNASGEKLTTSVTFIPLISHDKNPVFLIMIIRDVSAEARVQSRYKVLLDKERGRAEELHAMVEERTRELELVHREQLNRSKLESIGNLAGGIAHDFNNILTAIVTNISLSNRLITPDTREAMLLQEAEQACLRAKELTLQLLTFAKGGEPIKKTESIGKILQESAKFTLRGSNVRSLINVPEELWLVEVDAGQISQVIQNIVMNADQAMPDGGILEISAENVAVPPLVRQLKPGKYVCLSFKDTGTGISEENISKVFDPYFTTKECGTGLGMSTSYSIIKRHKGCIVIESVPGEGASVYVYLQAVKKTTKVAKVETSKLSIPPRGGSQRILIMDDEYTVAKGAQRILEHLGYRVARARDGLEALSLYRDAKLEGEPFDLVIMDLTIPGGMGGKTTIKRLLDENPEAKAIVSSGYSNDPVMSNYEKYGFIGVLPKPFNVKALGRAVEKALEG
jgi:signal transduction histidine kinase/CheY-like chemotaxis protein